MAAFQYKARNRRGESLTGVIEAESPEAVAEQLFNNSLTPIEIEPEIKQDEKREIRISRWFRPKVKLDELIMLCRQLYSLLRAGVPIMRSISSLVETTRNTTLAGALQSVAEDIQSGREFNAALARHEDIFSPLFISLVRVG